MGIENPVHLLFIAAVALLVLGPKRLPEVARSLGRGIREFREAMSDGSAGAAGGTGGPVGKPAPAPVPHSQAGVAVAAPSADPPAQVDPAEPVRSGDAPDRRPL